MSIETLEKRLPNTTYKIRANEKIHPTEAHCFKCLANGWVSAFNHGEGVQHALIADGPAASGEVLTGSFQECLSVLPEYKIKDLRDFTGNSIHE